MILDKPFNVGHFGEKGQICVIYSTDVHPDGTRFATGGGDHRVKIWSMSPFTTTAPSTATAAATADRPVHQQVQDKLRLLADLPQHTASVQCVRWSHDGRYLASASDDHYVLIWELRPGAASSAPFGSSDAPNVENWTRVWVLRGHTMDVLDCAWSADDSMVASCSIDNTVIVWRMPAASSGQAGAASMSGSLSIAPFRTLRKHKSFVKGVAWDPMGRFLASIGEDNRLVVWRVGGDWGVEVTLTAAFSGCEDTLVRRISWSPDGQCLVATNSKDRDVHRAVVFFRGRWEEPPTSLVGHTSCTLAASFSPTIYYKPAKTSPAAASVTKKSATEAAATSSAAGATAGASSIPPAAKSKPAAHKVVAIAGQDKVITVWLAAAKRPVAILREVFDKPPSDLSWGADGYTLVASGHDGTVVVLRFTPEELGLPLPEAERAAHFVKMYGADAGVPGSRALALDGAPSLIDNPRQLALERSLQKTAKASPVVAGTSIGQNGGGAGEVRTLVARPRLNQTESRSKGGKRRIQPTLMSSSGDASVSPASPPPRWEGSGGVPGAGTVSDGFGSSNGNSHKRPRTGSGNSEQNEHWPSSRKQQHSSGIIGVRQQAPIVVRLRSAGLPSANSSSPLPLVSPPELMPRRGATGSLVRQISGGSAKGAFRSPSRLREATSPTGEDHRSGTVETGLRLGLEGGPDGWSEGGRGSGSGSGDGYDSGYNKVAVLECSALETEFRGLAARRYTLVTVTRGGREAWRDYVAGTVTSCCGNARIAAVGAEDGSVYVYDRSGARSAPPLVISPPVAYLECNESPPPPSRARGAASAFPGGDQLMAISGDGDVFVWNLLTMTLTTKSSLAPIFRSMSTPSIPQGGTRQTSASAPSPSPPGSPTSSPRSTGAAATAAAGGGGGGSGATGVKGGVSVARAGVTAEGMPLVMLASPGAFGGSLQAFALHGGMGTWVRVADGRFALSDFYSSGPCTALPKAGTLSALQAGVRTGSMPTPSALLQASKLGVGSTTGSSAAAVAAAAAAGRRESLRLGVTRSHLEDSLATAALLGSPDEFADVLKSYAGHLAKNASLSDERIRALCDKLLLSVSGSTMAGGGRGVGARGQGEDRHEGSEMLGLRLGDGSSILGLDKIHLLKEVVLPALSGNRGLQRLVSEYYDSVELSSARQAPLVQRTSPPQQAATSPQGDPSTSALPNSATAMSSPVSSVPPGPLPGGNRGIGSSRTANAGNEKSVPPGGSGGARRGEVVDDAGATSNRTRPIEKPGLLSEQQQQGARDGHADGGRGGREIPSMSGGNDTHADASKTATTPLPQPSDNGVRGDFPGEGSRGSAVANGVAPVPTGGMSELLPGPREEVAREGGVSGSIERGKSVKAADPGPNANGKGKGKAKAGGEGAERMEEEATAAP